MIEGLSIREENALDQVSRYEDYQRYRGYGYSKKAARAESGMRRYAVEKCEEAELLAMLRSPDFIRAENGIPY